MRWLLTSVTILALTACTGTAPPRYLAMPGYAFKTDPQCVRTKPPSEFDERCDCPRIGYKGFEPPPVCPGQ